MQLNLQPVLASRKTVEEICFNEDGTPRQIYLWSLKGGSHVGHGIFNPVLQTATGDPFRIIPLEPLHSIQNNNATATKVAIQRVRNKRKHSDYLSCRTKFAPTNSSLAEYRQHIGHYEVFVMTHCEDDNTYLFQAHNGLLLHFNQTFHTCEFKTRSERGRGGVAFLSRATGISYFMRKRKLEQVIVQLQRESQ